MASNVVQPSEIHVTYEDQCKINEFASLNARLEELKDEVTLKSQELTNIEEALKEIDDLTITDEETVDVLEGGIFVKFSLEEATEQITAKKAAQESEIQALKDEMERIKDKMSGLKVELYAKLGRNNINLEADE